MFAFLGAIGSRLAGFNLKTIAQYCFVGLVCFGAGNYFATQRAVTMVAEAFGKREAADRDRAAREQAAATKALFEWKKTGEHHVIVEAHKAQSADDKAHDTLAESARQAVKTRDAALAQLQKERERNEGLLGTNAALASMAGATAPDRGRDSCAFSADTRRVLDEAAGAVDEGNRGAGAGAAETDAARGAVAAGAAPAASANGLTCDQLARGYVALGQHDREMIGRVEAWMGWYSERFGD
jgi:hypothetical protein